MPAAFAILDGIDDATASIRTVCTGIVSGTALLVLAGGTKGRRLALPHAQFQMTGLRSGGSGQVYGEAMRVEIQRMEELVSSQLAEYCGQPKDKVRLDLRHELFLDAYRAKEYRLIDEIVKV